MKIKLLFTKFTFLAVIFLFHSSAFSQLRESYGNQALKKIVVKGQCVDKVTDLAIKERVTILVFDSTGKINIDNFITKDDGSFFCEIPYCSKALITFSSVDYGKMDTLLKLGSRDTIVIGNIYLPPKITALKPVVVSGRKKIVELSFNKIIYNPGADSLNAGINTFDMLQKVPMIDIGNNNQIYVANNAGFVILINGKEKGILSQNPSAYLKTLPANLVKSVEISTSPPAKYTSQGIKYVINIIAEKKLLDGIYGNIGGGISSKQQEADAFFLAKRKKLGIEINSNFNRLSFPSMSSSYNLNIENTFISYQNSVFKSVNRVITPGISITYDSDTTLVFNADLYGTLGNNSNKSTTYVNNTFNLKKTDLIRHTNFSQDNGFIYYSLNAEKSLNIQKDLLSFSFQSYYRPGNNSLVGQTIDSSKNINSFYFNKGKAHLNEHTFQSEYIRHFSINKILSVGIKGITRNINSSNNFNDKFDTISKYSQKIISLFSDYSITLKKYQFRIGFNLNSSIFQNFTGNGFKNYEKSFFNFFPNFSISKQFQKNQFLSLKISDYVKRPGINQIAISSNYQNLQSIQQGNAYLKQEVDYNATVEYSKLIKYEPLIIDVFANYSGNQIMSQKSILNDSVLISSYSNLGKMIEWGNTFSYRFKILKNLNVGLNSTISFLKITNHSNVSQKESILNYSLSPVITYKFPGNILFAFRNYFYSKMITYQGYSSGYWDSRITFSKHFFNNTLTVEGIIYNPFLKDQKVNNFYSADSFSESSIVFTPQRYVGINIHYEFGDYLKSNVRKNKIKIRNTDMK